MMYELKGKRLKWFEGMILSIVAVSLAGLGVEFNNGRVCFFGLILLIPSLLYLLIRMEKSPKLLALLVISWILCAFIPLVIFVLSIIIGALYIVFVLFKGVME